MLYYAILYYTMLYYAFQVAVPELSFLAKPHQSNGYGNQMALVDPLEGYELDTPNIYRHLGHSPTTGLSVTIALIATALVATTLTSLVAF